MAGPGTEGHKALNDVAVTGLAGSSHGQFPSGLGEQNSLDDSRQTWARTPERYETVLVELVKNDVQKLCRETFEGKSGLHVGVRQI